MSRLVDKNNNAARRANRVRATLRVVSSRPRLSVEISNRHISAQVIDDQNSKTLLSVSTVGQTISGNMTEKASWVGKQVAQQSKSKKIKEVTLDRGSKMYHGRIKALAEAAREEGLVI